MAKSYRAWTEGRRSPGLFCFGAAALPISWIYQVAARCDYSRKQKKQLPALRNAVLIVVSSPLVGGVGKTPLTEHIAKQARDSGMNVAIVTMGYGRTGTGDVCLDSQSPDCSVSESGDEALMLHESTGCPVYVGDDLASVISGCDRSGKFDLVIFDDGISRSWNDERRVVVMSANDCERPVRFLPFGRWRTVPDFLSSGCTIAITGRDIDNAARQKQHRGFLRHNGYNGPVAWYETVTDGIVAIDGNSNSPVPTGSAFVFSGVGMPERFREQVRAQGITIGGEERFGDHHAYSQTDLQNLEDRAKAANCRYLLTTHKDAVKINPGWLQSLPLYYLNMSLRLVAGTDVATTLLQMEQVQN